MPSLTVTPVVFGWALWEALAGKVFDPAAEGIFEVEFSYGRLRLVAKSNEDGLYRVSAEFLSFAGNYQDFPGATWEELVELRQAHQLNVHPGTVMHLFLTGEGGSFMVVLLRGDGGACKGACGEMIPRGQYNLSAL